MPPLDLAAATEDLRKLAKRSAPTSDAQQHLAHRREEYRAVIQDLSQALREVNRYVRPPVSVHIVGMLTAYVEAALEFLDSDLEFINNTTRRVITGEETVVLGERLLDTLSSYLALAEHYFDDGVRLRRLNRPANEVALEVGSVTEFSAELKRLSVQFLEKLRTTLQSV